MQIKTTRRDYFIPLRRAMTKNLKITSVVKDVEKLKPLCAIDRNAKWCGHFGKWIDSFSNN